MPLIFDALRNAARDLMRPRVLLLVAVPVVLIKDQRELPV